MARIVFAWELGGGSGHLGPFYPIAVRLIRQGHEIACVVRHPQRVQRLFDIPSVAVCQSPLKSPGSTDVFPHPRTYPELLGNAGYADPNICTSQIQQWQAILEEFEPDILIADHAPGCLMAPATDHVPRVLLGSGFVSPPAVTPMPTLAAIGENGRVGTGSPTPQQLSAESKVLNSINESRGRLGSGPIDSIGGMFGSPARVLLTTFPQLDPYPSRPGGDYRGVIPYVGSAREPVRWPPGSGPKVFCYLKASRALGHLFENFRTIGAQCLIVMDSMALQPLRRLASSNMTFVDRPVSIQRVAAECDLAVVNATHGVTASMLSAGKPMLMMPLNLEQSITAKRCEEFGAGVVAPADDGLMAVAALHAVWSNPLHRDSAQRIANNLAGFCSDDAAAKIAMEINDIITTK